jgi:hypothetical protein
LETRGESFSEVPPARTTTWKSISPAAAVAAAAANEFAGEGSGFVSFRRQSVLSAKMGVFGFAF